MTELEATFAPDWVSPPGESILDIAEERGWTQGELAKRLGYTEKHISQLINSKVSINVDIAQKLERVLGSTMDFWLRREANYQQHKARLEAANRHAECVSWLDCLPVKDLMDNGAIEKLRYIAKNKPSIVESCLRFFGVASPDEWHAHYGGMQVDFRRSRQEQTDLGAISAWLRLGELKAEQLEVQKYNKTSLTKALKTIRSLTCEPPEVFLPKMKRLLHESGVLFVLVPSIPRARVSGVARWLRPTRPLIQLSLYGKTNDKFWFTFFHEAAHILLHANDHNAKKAVFLDDPNSDRSTDPKEHEANEWAANFLIPNEYSAQLPLLITKAQIKQFAKEVGIHPGIVVGRLHHEKIVPYNRLHSLKETFRFSTH